MSVAWGATQSTAVKAWIVAATGLAAAKVYRKGQRGGRPAPPFVSFAVELTGIGQDWVDNEDDPDDEGATIATARGNRLLTLTLTAYTAGQDPGAMEYLEAVRSAVALPSVEDALDLAGIGIGEIGPAQEFDETIAELLEAGARMVVTGFLASEITEAGSYIETVEIEGTIE